VAHAVQVLGSAGGDINADVQNKWVQLTMQDMYRSMSIWGLASGLVTAFAVLVLVTRSWSISIIAVGCLVQVVAGVLASLLAMGWTLGIVESLCLILISGLSVDYVLHVACAFAQALGSSNRVRRTEVALERIGAPLLAGATTTLCSAISLCTCTFVILANIGVFMLFTALWSYALASILLPALLATFGPEPTSSTSSTHDSQSTSGGGRHEPRGHRQAPPRRVSSERATRSVGGGPAPLHTRGHGGCVGAGAPPLPLTLRA
jgi:multidrug efflux pump subunit AcrB